MINGLPNKLRSLREQNNLSQRDVSTRLGISPSIVSGYETGDRTPSTEVLLQLAYLYKCSTDFLLGKDDSIPSFVLDTDGLTMEQLHALQSLINTMR